MQNDVTATAVHIDNTDWPELLDVIQPLLDPRAFHAGDGDGDDPYLIDEVAKATFANLDAARADIARVLGCHVHELSIDHDIIDAYDLVWIFHILDGREITEAAFIEYDIQPAN